MSSNLLLEFRRNDLTQQSKQSQREKQDNKTRFAKRTKSHIANSVKEYNEINMNTLFKKGLLTFTVNVKGETDNYKVTISFPEFLDYLKKYILPTDTTVSLRSIIRGLSDAYNRSEAVKISCTCDDYKYRFKYWNIMGGIDSKANGRNDGAKAMGKYFYAPQYDWTNKDNVMGSGCKHCQLVLANTSCLVKIASVINNYIKYAEKNMKKQYREIIFPAIFDREWEGQMDITQFGVDADKGSKYNRLRTGKELIKDINREQGKGNQFQKGNTQGIRFTKNSDSDEIPGQMSLFDDNEV